MDPDAALRMIDDADRVDAETREIMRGLHQWLSRGGFQPDWAAYPTGTRRYRKAYGVARKVRAHATKKGDPAVPVFVKLKDRNRGHVQLTVRDGIVVGAMGSEPKRYVGMTLDQAKHVARYGGTGTKKTTSSRSHAVIAHAAGNGGIQVGDIVQRSDIDGKNRYVVINIAAPWIYTRRISGSGGPGIITFPSPRMLRKVS
jgi:hypothetical protein